MTETGRMQYSILFSNASRNRGTACVFQQQPGIDPNFLPLAWMTSYSYPSTRIVFQWTLDYDFVWAETGPLVPGVTFVAAQLVTADLQSSNEITLAYSGGALEFQNQRQGVPGKLVITEASSVPVGGPFSVGVGMGGHATFAQQALPNWSVVYQPNPQFYIAFGDYSQGEVLDTAALPGTYAQVSFPIGVYSMTAVLNPDNSWSIMATSERNTALAQARLANSKAADEPS
ncbi:MAG TPA: protein rhiA [Blastocatellia bacterium]|nr:protein rhiA [Blastocatellia bacterium]